METNRGRHTETVPPELPRTRQQAASNPGRRGRTSWSQKDSKAETYGDLLASSRGTMPSDAKADESEAEEAKVETARSATEEQQGTRRPRPDELSRRTFVGLHVSHGPPMKLTLSAPKGEAEKPNNNGDNADRHGTR